MNIAKCQSFSCYRHLNPIIFNYSIHNTCLDRVDRKKDLGVILDIKLTFSLHIDYVISKANSMLGFVKRNASEFSDTFALKSLFISLVRSVLEYCSTVWCPYVNVASERIERIQRKFTRYAIYKLNWSIETPAYNTRCLLIGLVSLEKRRKYFSIMFIRDLLTYHIKCPPLLHLIDLHSPSRVLRDQLLFYEQFHRTNYSRNEPLSRCIREANSICFEVDFFSNCSRDTFKSKILFLLANQTV